MGKHISKIELFRDCMESEVKPLLDEQVYEKLMDLFDVAIVEAYRKGKERRKTTNE